MATIKWLLTPPLGVAIRPAVAPGFSTPNAISLEFAEVDTDQVLLWIKTTWEYYDMNKNGDGAAAAAWKERARQALNLNAVPPEVSVMKDPPKTAAIIPPEQRLAGVSAATRINTALGVPTVVVPAERIITTVNPPPPSSPGMAADIIEGRHPPTTPPATLELHYNPLLDGCPSCGQELNFTFFNGAMAAKCNTPNCAGISAGVVPLTEPDNGPEDGGQVTP